MRRAAKLGARARGVAGLVTQNTRPTPSSPAPRPASSRIQTHDSIVSRSLLHSKSRDNNSEALGTVAKLVSDAAATPVLAPKNPQHVTIADILDRRAKAGRLVAGTAAYSDSDMFKGPSSGKPKAKRWDYHLTDESKAREPCMLKQAAKHLKKPGLISLGGGLPCAENFPIESLSMKVPRVPHFSEEATRELGSELRIGKYDVAAGESEYDLSIALNYGQSTGSAQLMRFVTEHTELVCRPPYADWRCALTVGSTGALEQALRMLCDRARHDAVLTEEYSFSTALETAAPLGIHLFGVAMDAQGLLPDAMDAMLRDWDPAQRGGARRPHVLYTVPSGQNPTGATQGEQRRRDIYDVARRHDVFIIEDEPYYFLQMLPYAGKTEAAAAGGAQKTSPANEESVEDFLASLIPSLLSMDTDGRVLRMDSFSKVVVPGSRVGWITASEQVAERYIRHAEVASQGPSGVSQVLLHRLLDTHWGHDGYLRWLMHLRQEYTARRDVLLAACDAHLPRDVVSWNPPAAGMFHWLKIAHEAHPDAGSKSVLAIEDDIFNRCIAKGVLVARGSWFRTERGEHASPPTDLFFRATFAAATPENMAEAIRRFGAAVGESFGLE
ncbi:pyridoxal phosphate-dependent transferase [Lasiosphaeria ovina]|uniref:aromatic-amino-acid transaminase n=1 Tax=Lasiosphaeria ovina TaxID=92902 RepID=A0AAE0NKE2_9PEZI|nr:pyridoxal phosphate-dependent transferase [Lasiosphaeria ovina]